MNNLLKEYLNPKFLNTNCGLFRSLSLMLKACLQGGRVTLGSGLTLAGGQKIVCKQTFTGRVTLQPGTT